MSFIPDSGRVRSSTWSFGAGGGARHVAHQPTSAAAAGRGGPPCGAALRGRLAGPSSSAQRPLQSKWILFLG